MDKQFSRTYLQAMPEKRKQDAIEQRIQQHIQHIQVCAAQGKTSYIVEDPKNDNWLHSHPPPPTITRDEFIEALLRKFPDCSVSYQETWVVVNSSNKVLKKGIVIDWS